MHFKKIFYLGKATVIADIAVFYLVRMFYEPTSPALATQFDNLLAHFANILVLCVFLHVLIMLAVFFLGRPSLSKVNTVLKFGALAALYILVTEFLLSLSLPSINPGSFYSIVDTIQAPPTLFFIILPILIIAGSVAFIVGATKKREGKWLTLGLVLTLTLLFYFLFMYSSSTTRLI